MLTNWIELNKNGNWTKWMYTRKCVADHSHTHTYAIGKLCKWVAILWAVCTLLHRLLRCQSPPCLSFSSPSISVISFCMRRARHTHRDTKIPSTREGPPSHTLSLTHRTHTNAKLSFISFNTNLTMEQNKNNMNQKLNKNPKKKP